MRLDVQAREFYGLTIGTQPGVPAGATWDASFDGGVTFHPSTTAPDGTTRWLVAGPLCPVDPQTPAVVITATVVPIVRLAGVPEVVIPTTPAPPRIYLTDSRTGVSGVTYPPTPTPGNSYDGGAW